MQKTGVGFLIVLLLGGCVDSRHDPKSTGDKSPSANVVDAAQQPVGQNAAVESVTDVNEVTSSVDAERLLASTLASAKAQNKRVLVHLGAPW